MQALSCFLYCLYLAHAILVCARNVLMDNKARGSHQDVVEWREMTCALLKFPTQKYLENTREETSGMVSILGLLVFSFNSS